MAPTFEPDAAPVVVNPLPLLGYIDDAPSAAPAMPTTLNPNAPRKVPGMGGTPMSPDGIHRANVDRKDAETLLTSKEMDTRGDLAVRALDILNGIPDEQRGQVIDKLDDQAFENLLSRVPPDERERFSQLVASSQRPERKLRMWKEAHLSKSRNEVNARKGDVGEDDLQTEYDRKKLYSTLSRAKQNKADEKWEKKHEKELDALTDDDGFPLPDHKRTEKQQANLKSHRADVERATHTKEEIEHEVAMLVGDGKADKLTLDQVDKLIARKEREAEIERKRDLDISTTIIPGEHAKDSPTWSMQDLETIDRTLGKLPEHHHRGRDRLAQIHRSNANDVNGRWYEDDRRLEIMNPTLRQPDQARKDGSDELVSQLELTLTHEIGHVADDANPAAFEKFKAAAGWRAYSKDTLVKDGVSEQQIATLESERSDANAKHSHEYGRRRTYSPNLDSDSNETKPYWGVDQSAIPGGSEWNYARVNPTEHFAEAYEMAVHDPAKFHEQHVTEPREQAQKARDRVANTEAELAKLDPTKDADQVRELREVLARQRARAAEAERSVQQLGGQFQVMRNDVFGTDKAAQQATARLRLRNLDEAKMKEFEARAAALSTPAQIEALEAKYR